jgi:hypothetical protein
MEAYMNNSIEETAAVTLNIRGTLFVVDTKYLDNIFFHILINSDPAPIRGHYFIDRPFEGFDRILNAMRGEAISYEGLNDYEAQCIDANLKYFQLPYPRFKRVFKESKRFEALKQNDASMMTVGYALDLITASSKYTTLILLNVRWSSLETSI